MRVPQNRPLRCVVLAVLATAHEVASPAFAATSPQPGDRVLGVSPNAGELERSFKREWGPTSFGVRSDDGGIDWARLTRCDQFQQLRSRLTGDLLDPSDPDPTIARAFYESHALVCMEAYVLPKLPRAKSSFVRELRFDLTASRLLPLAVVADSGDGRCGGAGVSASSAKVFRAWNIAHGFGLRMDAGNVILTALTNADYDGDGVEDLFVQVDYPKHQSVFVLTRRSARASLCVLERFDVVGLDVVGRYATTSAIGGQPVVWPARSSRSIPERAKAEGVDERRETSDARP